MDRLREWFDNLLDKFFSGLVRFGSHAPWIVWLLRILLIVAVCTALVWFLLRIERRSRLRVVPEIEVAAGAPSAREWQLVAPGCARHGGARVSGARPSTFSTGLRSRGWNRSGCGLPTAPALRASILCCWPANDPRKVEPDGAHPEL